MSYSIVTHRAAAAAICILLLFGISCGMTLSYPAARAEQPEIVPIAKFSTYYGDSSENRKHNVALAAKAIDGFVLPPEEEFSFNDTVGARTEERGYRTAYIISEGNFVEGVGGGVCQVSGTLYNCALLADLAVTCVHPHSLPVSYVAPSFDAMVSSASDLRFANTLSAPVTIRMIADGKYLRAERPSKPSPNRRSMSPTPPSHRERKKWTPGARTGCARRVGWNTSETANSSKTSASAAIPISRRNASSS